MKKGFVLLPKRRVVERSFAWTARFRRLARDYERLASSLAALHYVAFAMLMLSQLARSAASSQQAPALILRLQEVPAETPLQRS